MICSLARRTYRHRGPRGGVGGLSRFGISGSILAHVGVVEAPPEGYHPNSSDILENIIDALIFRQRELQERGPQSNND